MWFPECSLRLTHKVSYFETQLQWRYFSLVSITEITLKVTTLVFVYLAKVKNTWYSSLWAWYLKFIKKCLVMGDVPPYVHSIKPHLSFKICLLWKVNEAFLGVIFKIHTTEKLYIISNCCHNLQSGKKVASCDALAGQTPLWKRYYWSVVPTLLRMSLNISLISRSRFIFLLVEIQKWKQKAAF